MAIRKPEDIKADVAKLREKYPELNWSKDNAELVQKRSNNPLEALRKFKKPTDGG
jgi:hypothetical protein